MCAVVFCTGVAPKLGTNDSIGNGCPSIQLCRETQVHKVPSLIVMMKSLAELTKARERYGGPFTMECFM